MAIQDLEEQVTSIIQSGKAGFITFSDAGIEYTIELGLSLIRVVAADQGQALAFA